MKVILKADIKGVGKKDQVIEASDGYARNFLLPKNLAVEANAENMSKLKSKNESKAYQKEQEKEAAMKVAEKLSKILLKMPVKTGENGKVFGSAPEILKGLLEVRGIGIVKYPYAEKVQVQLVVDLLKTAEEVERMPKNAHENILGVEIAKIDLYAKESSAPEKVLLKLNCNIVNDASI